LPLVAYSRLPLHASPTTDIYTLSLHDALPIYNRTVKRASVVPLLPSTTRTSSTHTLGSGSSLIIVPTACAQPISALPALLSLSRSEEHTSELQSRSDLVCRLLLETNKPEPCPG